MYSNICHRFISNNNGRTSKCNNWILHSSIRKTNILSVKKKNNFNIKYYLGGKTTTLYSSQAYLYITYSVPFKNYSKLDNSLEYASMASGYLCE